MAATLLALAAAVGAGHLLGAPTGDPIGQGVRNSLHIVFFAGLAAASYTALRALSVPQPAVRTVTFVIACGLIGETLQQLTGNRFSAVDLARDLFGAGCGLYSVRLLFYNDFVWVRARNMRRLAAFLAIALAFAPLSYWGLVAGLSARSAPQIAGFEAWWERPLVAGLEARVRFDAAPAGWPDAGRIAEVALTGAPYSGVAVRNRIGDWGRYDALVLTVAAVGSDALPLTIRVHDERHDNRYDDRFNREVVVGAEPATIRIPIAQIAGGPAARRMDLNGIAAVTVFTNARAPGAGLIVGAIRLE